MPESTPIDRPLQEQAAAIFVTKIGFAHKSWLLGLVLALLVAKVEWEYATGRALSVNIYDGMMVLPLAHVAGLLSGLGYWVALII